MLAAQVPIETPAEPFTDADEHYAEMKQYLVSPEACSASTTLE